MIINCNHFKTFLLFYLVITTTRPPPVIVSDICTGPDQYFAHPYDCKKFIKCALIDETNEITDVEQQCPDGLLFNAAIKVCDWPLNSGCQVVSTTTIKPSKEFI